MAEQPYADCPQILRDYLFYLLTIKGRSARTVDAYYIDIRTFFRFLVLHKSLGYADLPFEKLPIHIVTLDVLKTVTLSDAYEYLHYISTERSNSAKTRSRKVSSLKSFFHYLCDKVHLLPQNPMAELPMPHPSSVTVPLSALDSLILPPFLFLVFPRRNHP
mgnify:CR=1 FL=1